jgi:hypothetical protein
MISDQYGRTKSSTRISLMSTQDQSLTRGLRKERAHGWDEPLH